MHGFDVEPLTPDNLDALIAEHMRDPQFAAAFEDARDRAALIQQLVDARRRAELSINDMVSALAAAHRMRPRRARRWIRDLEGGRLMADAPLWLLTFYARATRAGRVRLVQEAGCG
jgi:hypothetical protein